MSHFLCALVEDETDAEPKCCDRPPEQRHPACWPIDIPPQDPFYSLFRRRCMEFVRSAAGLEEYCKLGLLPQSTTVSSLAVRYKKTVLELWMNN